MDLRDMVPVMSVGLGAVVTALLGAVAHLFIRVGRLEVANARLETVPDDIREIRRAMTAIQVGLAQLGHNAKPVEHD